MCGARTRRLHPNTNGGVPTARGQRHPIRCHADGSDAVLVALQLAVVRRLERVPRMDQVVIGRAHDVASAQRQCCTETGTQDASDDVQTTASHIPSPTTRCETGVRIGRRVAADLLIRSNVK